MILQIGPKSTRALLLVVILVATCSHALSDKPRRSLEELNRALNSLTADQKARAKAFFALPNSTIQDDMLHQWAQTAPCQRVQKCVYTQPNLFCAQVCDIGSLQVDPVLQKALQIQRELQLDTPLNFWSVPGTHNSGISRAYGQGIEEAGVMEMLQDTFGDPSIRVYIANQEFSFTDQLNMGIRHLELDTHWWDGNLRICHAGGVHIAGIDNFINFLNKYLGFNITWDTETLGCWGENLVTLNDTLKEIKAWYNVPQNQKEFAIFMFDDQPDLEEWHKVFLIDQGIAAIFGNSVFTPPDLANLFGGKWPTLRQLQSSGKNIMFVSRTNYSSDMLEWIFDRDSLWNEYSVTDKLVGFPTCTIGNSQEPIAMGNMIRDLSDSLIYGPFENGAIGSGLFLVPTLQEVAKCAVNFPCADQMSPKLTLGNVWSWATGQPSLAGGCTLMQPDGTWSTVACTGAFRYACRSNSATNINAQSWQISRQGGPWTSSGCPAGYSFAVPTNGLHNAWLVQAVATSGASLPVWLNYKYNP